MKPGLLEILACPMCKDTPLKLTITQQVKDEIVSGRLACSKCGRIYPIKAEIPELMPDTLTPWYHGKGSPDAYDDHFDKWLPQTRRQTVAPWPFKLVIAKKAKGLVLDAGCGPGILNKYLPNAVFLDFSRICLIKRWTGVSRPRVRASAEDLPFRHQVFDTVIATELIEHTDNPHRFVEEVHRILREGGQFLFSFPWSDVSSTHKWKNITTAMIESWVSPPFTKYEWDTPPVRKERGMVYAYK